MKKIIKSLYFNLPVWIQNLAISIYGNKLRKSRYGKHYQVKFEDFCKDKSLNLDDELTVQNLKLVEFVNFAVKNSEYYRRKYSHINLAKFKGLKDLNLLPPISKEELRENLENIYTIEDKDAIKSFTGGTTGKSLEVRFTLTDFQERMAYLDAFKSKLNVDIDPFKSSKATFSGRELLGKKAPKNNVFWRYNKAYNQKLYSTFHMNDKTLPFYIKELNRSKPEILNGFVSAIYELAKFVESNNVSLSFIPKAIFTTSETLLPFHRELIEKVFNSKIYNQYASAEGAPFITECVEGSLHYNIDTGVIENKEGSNSILVTSFTTYGTPLIRYDIGDEVEFMEGDCKCGSSHPLVKAVRGRMVDFLVAMDSSKVSLSHLADVIKGMPTCIKKVQFCQSKPDEITVKLVIDEFQYHSKYNDLIIDSVKYRFGDAVYVKIEQVDDIAREKSGKYSLIKNKLNDGK